MKEKTDNLSEKVEEIEINKIGDFPNHPFKIRNDEEMEEMVNSVKEYGVIMPVIVRKKDNDRYNLPERKNSVIERRTKILLKK